MDKSVNVTWLGHACFRLEYGDWSVVTDPYGDGSVEGLGPVRCRAGAVYCSHDHHDHNAVEHVALTGGAAPADFAVEIVKTAHDDCGGAKRGPNRVHIFSFGGLRVAHMGDLGHLPGEDALEKIRGCDLMLLPIGGFFTIDCAQALEVVRLAAPRAVVPMHYRTEKFGFEVLSTPDAFIAGFPADRVTTAPGSGFVLTASEPRGLVLLTPALLE